MSTPTQTRPSWTPDLIRETAADDQLSAAALRLAAAGVPVFPCVPGGKQPLTRRGFHDASTSPRQVRRWWQRTPDANVAIPTGAASGIVVVDVDCHPSGSGFAAFEAGRQACSAEGWGWLVRTPSGGLHAYYAATADVEQRCWQAPRAHVDFRGDGGYIIAPPSRITLTDRVASYALLTTSNAATLDSIDADRLHRFLDPPPPRRAPHGPPLAPGSQPENLASWVAGLGEGERNHGLFWAACRMVEGGHHYATTLQTLGTSAEEAGLNPSEIETTIRSAYRTTTPQALGHWERSARPSVAQVIGS